MPVIVQRPDPCFSTSSRTPPRAAMNSAAPPYSRALMRACRTFCLTQNCRSMSSMAWMSSSSACQLRHARVASWAGHRQLRPCLQLHGFAVEQREHRSEGIRSTPSASVSPSTCTIGNPPEPSAAAGRATPSVLSAELGLSPRIGSRETDGKNPDGKDRAIPPRGAMGVDQRHW